MCSGRFDSIGNQLTVDSYKRLLINQALSYPKGGLVLERHDDTAKERGALGYRYLILSAITYTPK